MSIATMSLVGGIAALALVVGAGPSYRSGVPLVLAMGMIGLGAVIGFLALCGASATVLLGVKRGQPLSAVAVAGLVFGLIAFAVPFHRVWSARHLPSIHDISTDLDNPPTFQAVLPLREGAANGVDFDPETAAQQRVAYPDIRTLRVAAPPGDVFDRAIDVARGMSWAIVAADRAAGRIEATASTRWFDFKDDVVIRIAGDGTDTKVDVRSVSRVGRGDLGTNAERVRDFLSRLNDE